MERRREPNDLYRAIQHPTEISGFIKEQLTRGVVRPE
jgi:hypothetical protein